MTPIIATGKFSKNAVFSGILLLAACGANEPGSPPRQSAVQPPQGAAIADESPTSLLPNEEQAASPAPTEDLASLPEPVELVPDAAVIRPTALAAPESIVLAAAYTQLVPATINAKPSWPVWWGTGKPVGGVNCLVNGKNHLHSLISIYRDGKRLGFPDGIGRVHAGCYHAYELHVHDVTGIIHMETDVPKRFKLGQWFSLWGQPLSRDMAAGLPGPVRYYVIEKEKITPYVGNPYDIEMVPHREILIVSGTPMSVVPKYKWPAGI
jgi:hypothetical protein